MRLPGLSNRMMHADEAVQAYRAGELWQGRGVRYDPADYHGLSLPYLTLPALALGPAPTWGDTVEWQYRLVPALAGTAAAAAVWLLADGIGPGAWAAVALAALSPASVFYGRAALHEPLLVLFTFGVIACGWRWQRSRRSAWLWAAGLSGGLALATKETAVLALAAMLGAAVSARVRLPWRRMAGPAAAGVALALLIQSSFLAHPAGILDAIRAPILQAVRGAAGGAHAHPWTFYFGLLPGDGVIVALAVVGAVGPARFALRTLGARPWQGAPGAVAGGPVPRFLAVYGALLFLLYTAIPYKTPWCALGFLHALAVPAGAGVAAALSSSRRRILAPLLLLGAIQLGAAAVVWGVFRTADPWNPYAYAATSPDARGVEELLGRLAAVHPDGTNLPVAVTTRDAWPLPWLLRRFPGVGWYDAVPPGVPPPVVIAAAGQGGRPGPAGTYVTSHFGLRRGVVLAVHVRAGLWNAMMKRSALRQGSGSAPRRGSTTTFRRVDAPDA